MNIVFQEIVIWKEKLKKLTRNILFVLQKIQIWLKSQKGPIEVYLCPEDGPNTGTNLSQQAAAATAGKGLFTVITFEVKGDGF